MSRPERKTGHLLSHALCLVVLLAVSGSVGCWEQWSEAWWPQMKWQKAVQAFEPIEYQNRVDPFMPPEGTVAVDALPPLLPQYDPAVDNFKNPQPANFKSLARGQKLFTVYCQPCHGVRGMGDGPVSAAGDMHGPFAGVFPVVTAIGRSDGYIFNLIRGGGVRMPSYQRIPPADRWNIVNYVRYLQKGGQP